MSEGVELVPFRLLTPHFLTLPIRLISIALPFVGAAGMVIVAPEAVITGAEGIVKTEGWVGNGGVGLRIRTWRCWQRRHI